MNGITRKTWLRYVLATWLFSRGYEKAGCYALPRKATKGWWRCRITDLMLEILKHDARILTQAIDDKAFLAGDRWGERISDTLKIRKPIRFRGTA